jgi:hypothetical protein
MRQDMLNADFKPIGRIYYKPLGKMFIQNLGSFIHP